MLRSHSGSHFLIIPDIIASLCLSCFKYSQIPLPYGINVQRNHFLTSLLDPLLVLLLVSGIDHIFR